MTRSTIDAAPRADTSGAPASGRSRMERKDGLQRVFRPVHPGASLLAAVVVPRFLGVLVFVAGLGYVFDSLAAVLAVDAPEVATVAFVGEVLLAIWLLVRSRRLEVLDGPSVGGQGAARWSARV